jgi:hypothetical protein
VLIATVIAVAGAPMVMAKRIKHVAHHDSWSSRAQNAQASATGPARLGPTHYYGGPKSPMWSK